MTAVLTTAVLALVVIAAIATGWAMRAQRRADHLRQALSRLSDALATGDDREALLGVVLDTALVMGHARGAVLWMDQGPSYVARMVRGRVATEVGAHRSGAELGDGALLFTLHARSREYGRIALHGAEPGGSRDLQALVRQASAALDATYDHEEARHLSITDGLTGLWNRRQLDVRCVEELDRAGVDGFVEAAYGEKDDSRARPWPAG